MQGHILFTFIIDFFHTDNKHSKTYKTCKNKTISVDLTFPAHLFVST